MILWRIQGTSNDFYFNFGSFGAVSSMSPTVNAINVNDSEHVGNWSVGNCILAKFAMNFTVSYNISKRSSGGYGFSGKNIFLI